MPFVSFSGTLLLACETKYEYVIAARSNVIVYAGPISGISGPKGFDENNVMRRVVPYR